jgi:hypothetical protein
MKLENQVCNLEQAARLKELGVKQDSHFFWVNRKEKSKLVYAKNIECLETLPICSAFTISELGQMLDSETGTQRNGSEDSGYANWEWVDNSNQLGMGMFATEVEARADMLITLLQKNLIQVETCNERLIA